ncbi:hypothetical protein CCACVL1_28744 [Corchorus capsularis]|uniref:Uncharacterized protein n=1 Tax=Corchorus capsularis TaxID=210143 RepID=A0A1R3G5C7_COCAP|nr:hypothetical protein CCACVL1_28744 [Corchorus capsularis]
MANKTVALKHIATKGMLQPVNTSKQI